MLLLLNEIVFFKFVKVLGNVVVVILIFVNLVVFFICGCFNVFLIFNDMFFLFEFKIIWLVKIFIILKVLFLILILVLIKLLFVEILVKGKLIGILFLYKIGFLIIERFLLKFSCLVL